ncbi:MAG: alpha/beta hydrolase-fold protein [Pseudomonadota bacterium]
MHARTLQLATLAGCLLVHSLAGAQTTPAAAPAPAFPPVARPTPPTRLADGPEAPPFTKIEGNGASAPIDKHGDFVIGPHYVPARELSLTDGVKSGTVQQFQMDSADSKFYPGIARDAFGTVDPNNPKTVIVATHAQPYQRTITVYMPAQYQHVGRAAFLVTHDGPKFGEPDVTLPRLLDNLIAQKRIPVIVAIMIQNGGGDAQGSERGLEYDTMSGKFAEYIEAEVLPAVEKKYDVKLSRKPGARAVMGCSSGAAAAFTMAWTHPEWYQRVISFSGTYVNQQWPFNPETPGGAWGYHESIIASAAKKPIRVWMHVGDRDLYNPNAMRDDMHDWVIANHRMAKVLKDKGYDYQYSFALDSGHCDGRVRAQTLPQALEWVWRGYGGK